jgi:exodeoxyribonuclease VII large subunit
MSVNKVLPFFGKNFYTVTELTEDIKSLLENEYFDIKVVGEISNLSVPISGHSYFTLKDGNASIRCVLFRSQRALVNFDFKNGDEVLLRGRISVYAPRGEYQIIVDWLEAYGTGKLFLKFEELKRKLSSEGLFNTEYKKSLPEFPEKIVVITSKTGAAIKDILNIIKRRFSGMEILILPVQVQGSGAAKQIKKAVEFVNKEIKDCDIIILSRGGGSIEDLMPFNDEEVARAVFASKIPVISAVGHETDFTITDFVADLRAPTPSAAAELVVKNKTDLTVHLDNIQRRIVSAMNNTINIRKAELSKRKQVLNEYYILFKNIKFKIFSMEQKIANETVSLIREKREKLNTLDFSLHKNNPLTKIPHLREVTYGFTRRIKACFINELSFKKQNLHHLIQLLNSLNPVNILAKGYSVTYKENQIITDSTQVKQGDEVKIKLSTGELIAKIIRIL